MRPDGGRKGQEALECVWAGDEVAWTWDGFLTLAPLTLWAGSEAHGWEGLPRAAGEEGFSSGPGLCLPDTNNAPPPKL